MAETNKSRFKQLHPAKTIHEEMKGAEVLKERDIDPVCATRIIKVDKSESSYPYIVEVVRKPFSEDEVNFKFQDFKTLEEAERFMSRII